MQTNRNGKETLFSWVTNTHINQANVFVFMRGGRSWKIENETFNTLKNLGCNFEHNYGHGKQYFSTIFCLLTLLSFLLDQVQAIACSLFESVKKQVGSFRNLWGKIKVLLEYGDFNSWEYLYPFMIERRKIDTS